MDSEEQKRCRTEGLGGLSILSDRLVIKVLKRLANVEDLLTLATVSRAAHQFANWEEIWRSLCLDLWGGAFSYRHSWKVTTLFPDLATPVPDALLPYPSKMLIKGFFSEDMYRRWWYATHCRDLGHWTVPWDSVENDDEDDEEDVDSAVGGRGTMEQQRLPLPPLPPAEPPGFVAVERISAASMSIEEFRLRYVTANRPVIITDVVRYWRSAGAATVAPASAPVPADLSAIHSDEDNTSTHPSTWEEDSDSDSEEEAPTGVPVAGPTSPYFWSPDTLAKRFEKSLFKINSYNKAGRRIKMTMKDYVDYMRTNNDAYPLYIFDSKFGDRCPDMLLDYDVPPHFWEDLFAALPDDAGGRPPYRWLVMGPTRSGTPFHIDPNGTSAWNALLWGKKRWALYPPTPPGYPTPPGVDPHTHKAPHPLIWWSEIYPRLPAPALPPMEVIQEAGDMIFVPSGWWHAVLNLTDTVAVTQNFVNLDNLDGVVASLIREGREKMVEFWKRRLMPLRPELFGRITQQQQSIRSIDQAHAAQRYRHMLQKERKKTSDLQAEITRLKAELEAVKGKDIVPSGTQ